MTRLAGRIRQIGLVVPDANFAYFSGSGDGWPQLEISEALRPANRMLFERLDELNGDVVGGHAVGLAPDVLN